jgi:hypothetical protein
MPSPKTPPAKYDPTEKTVGALDYYYKVVGDNGCDLFSGVFSYPETVGMCAYIAGDEGTRKPVLCTSTVLHASPSLPFAVYYGLRIVKGATKHFRAYEVYGQPVAKDDVGGKFGFREFDVIREVSGKRDVVELLRSDPLGRKRLGRPAGPATQRLSVADATIIWNFCFTGDDALCRRTRPVVLRNAY